MRLLAPGLLITLPALVMTSCAVPSSQQAAGPEIQAALTRQDLEVVDCLLPGQVRRIGTAATYLTQRRPVRTTASDCRIRGGEYVAFDRADLKSSLAVWLQSAEAGDAEAQTIVGEIYERGLGTEPNPEVAAFWYQKAADAGYSRALFNLGTLYEQGQGVQQDRLQALNLYRRAWGLPEDSLIYQSAAAREREALRSELETQLAEKDAQMAVLNRQLQRMELQLSEARAADRTAQADAEILTLKKMIASLEMERRVGAERLAGIVRLRMPQGSTAQPAETMSPAQERRGQDLDFGRFYALVIGNQNYRSIDSLQTPISDVQRAAKVLADKYGFTVRIIEDGNDVAMLKALNDLNGVLRPNDNALIYYAGHGYRLPGSGPNRQTESGYWLPVNAEAPPEDTFWVPNEQVTAHLARLPARRVLVVADSCYAGLLSSDPGYLFVDDSIGYSADYIRFKLPKRSRLLLSSGGDHPVLDTGGGENSVFARAFLEELETNTAILPAPELFARIRQRVEVVAARNTFVQSPELKSIKGAGHEVGDFFFVPVAQAR